MILRFCVIFSLKKGPSKSRKGNAFVLQTQIRCLELEVICKPHFVQKLSGVQKAGGSQDIGARTLFDSTNLSVWSSGIRKFNRKCNEVLMGTLTGSRSCENREYLKIYKNHTLHSKIYKTPASVPTVSLGRPTVCFGDFWVLRNRGIAAQFVCKFSEFWDFAIFVDPNRNLRIFFHF